MSTTPWACLDVHARSVEAAALHVITGELTRRRFGGDGQAVIGWLTGLPGPVLACDEADQNQGQSANGLPSRSQVRSGDIGWHCGRGLR